jgi:hypothetical protein
MKNELAPVSLAQQERMGLRHPQRANYVPPERASFLPPATTYTIDAAPSAVLESHTHTNAVDRAKGYLLIQAPLAVVVAVLVVTVGKALADYPLLSLSAFLIFWLSFAVTWLAGWGITLLLSAEGVAFYEARRKWNVVEREQDERRSHYNRQFDEDQSLSPTRPRLAGLPPKLPRWDDGIDWRAALYATGVLWLLIMSAWVMMQ